MIEEMLLEYADKGFVYGLAVYLLWKGHTQDKEYLKVLMEIKDAIVNHVKEKERLIEMLKNQQEKR